jgi:hypothetical protein
VVQLEDGSKVEGRAAQGLAIGAAVLACVRPEDLTVADAAEAFRASSK